MKIIGSLILFPTLESVQQKSIFVAQNISSSPVQISSDIHNTSTQKNPILKKIPRKFKTAGSPNHIFQGKPTENVQPSTIPHYSFSENDYQLFKRRIFSRLFSKFQSSFGWDSE
jgi:hypothetical protein